MSLPAGTAIEAAATSAQVRTETVLARAFVIVRLAGLAELGVVLGLDWDHYGARGLPNLVLAGVVAAESACLLAAVWRRASVPPHWIGSDIAFMVVGLAAGALLSSPAWAHTWVYFMYPFSVITCYAVGIAFARWWSAASVTLVLAAGYFLSATVIHHEVVGNVLPNSLTYFANTLLAWVIARELRRSARDADESRTCALTRAGELARERERARHGRLLHDRVLQTLESLSQRRSIADDDLRRHVAAEAAWLRGLVEGGGEEPGEDQTGLVAGLRRLVEHAARSGVRVELNAADLDRFPSVSDPPADLVAAVVGATREALTNVAKHAGTETATVRAWVTGDRLTVTIVDGGRGFDPQRTPWRTGLRASITDRVTEIGGQVGIDSVPGGGTAVELSVPVRSPGHVDSLPGRLRH